ncbi:MAG: EFR1 family ferrodoxin [Candidatus Sabulitectum sp.]|nr:EFR1 family ferrodoxin [Candidatus Sabulitectum sp.]
MKIARDLAEALGDSELVSIARATEEQLSPGRDIVGIVFPVYAWGPPPVVIRFLNKVSISSDKYVFAVCTCASSAGGTLMMARKQLSAKGITLSSGFVIPMPTNYIMWGEALPEEKQKDMFAKAFANGDRKFTLNETCNSCGICEKVCQVGNIEMKNGKPNWLHSCEQCLACLQWCPQEAIQVGRKTAGRKRYHHPEIKASDLMQCSNWKAESGI